MSENLDFRCVVTMRDALAQMQRELRLARTYAERYGDDGRFETRERHAQNVARANQWLPLVEQVLIEGVQPSEEMLRICHEAAGELYARKQKPHPVAEQLSICA